MSKQYPGGIISKTAPVPSGPYSTDTASGVWSLDQQAYWQKLGQWPTAGNNPTDPQFNYVTMLLHGDGTNGAQNNTFLDSSTNNFSITRNGNTTQGSFSPYGANWSNYFNGTNAYLTPPASSVVLGSSDFTVEYWLFASNNNSHLNSASTAGGTFTFLLSSNAAFYWGNGSAWEDNIPFTSGTLAQNTWHHIAMTRQSSTMRLFLNGVLQGSATVSVSIPSNYWQLGAQTRNSVYLDGYLSNFRIVSGTALYTSNFTPSTTPLTAVSGTSLLTCQSNRFVDNSASPLTITVNGTPSVQRFNPFGASTAYSTSVIGGSGYFDGSGDSLSLPNNVALDFGTGDFTIEVWIYPTSLPTSYQCVFITCDNVGSAGGIGLFTQSTGEIEVFEFVGNSAVFSTSGFNLKTNQWTNIAITRSGSTNTLYKNGVSFATATNSTNYNSSTDAVIGNSTTASQYFYGYISALRVLKGTAQAPTITTPPTNITNTSLLLNMTNGAIFDNAMMNDLETVGNAQISTSVVKYGTGSIKCTGDGNTTTTNSGYLLPNSLNSNLSAFGTGNFTIEFWLYLNSTSGLRALLDFRGSTETASPVLYINGGTLTYYVESDRITGSSLSTSTWYHIALCRSSGSTKLFVNGTQSGSTFTDSINYANASTRTPVIGANSYTGSGNTLGWYALDGYIDDLRITKGYARYTANFTPPTAAFFNYGPT